ncbi:hypothetical protein V8E55_000291 [Tylopilus felleus]
MRTDTNVRVRKKGSQSVILAVVAIRRRGVPSSPKRILGFSRKHRKPLSIPAVKASLAQRYNSFLSAINSWFINARRRMGWTALCRDHFSNCRADALDAAHRTLVEEDPNRRLPPHIIHAFISVNLASDLDTKVTIDLTKTSLVPPNCYPSPDHSPFSSPVPALDESLTDESEDEDVLPPILAGRKRRFSSSERARTPISQSTTRPMKRSRYVGLFSVSSVLELNSLYVSNQPHPQYLFFSGYLSAVSVLWVSSHANDAYMMQIRLGCQEVREIRWQDHVRLGSPSTLHTGK